MHLPNHFQPQEFVECMAMECDFQASLVNIPDQAMVQHNQEREKADKVDPVMVLEHRSWGLVWLKYKKYELGIEVCRIFLKFPIRMLYICPI